MAKRYKCEVCGGKFVATDEEDIDAHAEAEELWGKNGHAPDMAAICDVCFNAMKSAGYIPPRRERRIETFQDGSAAQGEG